MRTKSIQTKLTWTLYNIHYKDPGPRILPVAFLRHPALKGPGAGESVH